MYINSFQMRGCDDTLTDLRIQQMEALKEVSSYSIRLLKVLPWLSVRMHGVEEGMMDWKSQILLNQFLEGLNWVIKVTNKSMDYINESKIRINQRQVSNTMDEFNCANLAHDYIGMAEVMENGIQIFLEDIQRTATELK